MKLVVNFLCEAVPTLQGCCKVPLKRSAFDDAEAAIKLSQYATPSSRATVDSPAVRNSHYLAVGAAGALLCFIEEEEHLILIAGSLSMCFQMPSTYMQIDPSAVTALELVQQLGGDRVKSGCHSLFGHLNLTKTTCGARLLRANILQPLTHTSTLNTRYDAVEELRAKDDMLLNAVNCLSALPRDLDRVCGTLVCRANALSIVEPAACSTMYTYTMP